MPSMKHLHAYGCVWQEAHLYDGFTQTISPRLPPDIQMIEMCFKPASHWPASRALIGRYAEGGPAYATAIQFINSVIQTYTR